MTSLRVVRPAMAAGMLVVALAACGGSDDGGGDQGSAAPAGGAASDQIEVKDFDYKPETATVKVGTKVTWTFKDDALHNVEPIGDSELVKSPDLKSGGTYSFTFTKPGMMGYRCGIHNYMTASVM